MVYHSASTNKPKLLDRVRETLRMLHYSYRTEESYLAWIKRYILFHLPRHPQELGPEHVRDFLSSLATKDGVAASSQNQALAAILFLYQQVLGIDFGDVTGIVRAKRPEKLPLVLSVEEVRKILDNMSGVTGLMARVLYGTGLRLMECLRLRVQDIDFERNQILVRAGKGQKDRVTMLPASLKEPLRKQIATALALHRQDLAEGYGETILPFALDRKYPAASKEPRWQFVFPASHRSIDPRSGKERRHHLDPTTLQKAVRQAVQKAGITKPASCHTFRHSFATHLLEAGYDIRTIQELLGHANVETTMIYTHVIQKGGAGVKSPLDRL
jgi:integron integrase